MRHLDKCSDKYAGSNWCCDELILIWKKCKIADHLGSTRVMVNNAGVLAASDYKPFGEPITMAGAVTGVRKGFIDKEDGLRVLRKQPRSGHIGSSTDTDTALAARPGARGSNREMDNEV